MADDAVPPNGGLSGWRGDGTEPAFAQSGAPAHGLPPSEGMPKAPARRLAPDERLALIAGLTGVVVLSGLAGWLGFRAYEAHNAEVQRNLFLQAARRCAVSFTTFDYEHAQADVQRVLNSATGTFYHDFSQRSQSFIDLLTQGQSKSVGTVTEAGVESQTGDKARVLVAVTVQTSNPGAAEQPPQDWRMRLTMQKSGDHQAKVSNLAFVS